jgi:very-short-patch-repair endonuclease
MSINEEYVVKQYENFHSTYSIAKELGTYPKKIERILKKRGIERRNRSEAQRAAIQTGRTEHPTKGRKRTDEEKVKISEGVYKNWKNMPDSKKENISKNARERWDKIPADKKRDMMEKAGVALNKTCSEGSRAEKYIYERIQESGIDVVMHKQNLIEGNFEMDLFLPGLKTIIEIDGPQHFMPLFGEKKLRETVKLDSIKSGSLISKGYCVIRVKYMLKRLSQKSARDLWTMIQKELDRIQGRFPAKKDRFIELEIK